MTDYKTMAFEEFELQWKGMLNRFAGWEFGMPREDLEQELRIVMWQCQQRWEPTKGASMSTYLWNALWNKTNKLRCGLNFTRSRVPTTAYAPLDDYMNLSSSTPFFSELDLLKGVGQEGAKLASLIMLGYDKPVQWKKRGLSTTEIERGKQELARALEVPHA